MLGRFGDLQWRSIAEGFFAKEQLLFIEKRVWVEELIEDEEYSEVHQMHCYPGGFRQQSLFSLVTRLFEENIKTKQTTQNVSIKYYLKEFAIWATITFADISFFVQSIDSLVFGLLCAGRNFKGHYNSTQESFYRRIFKHP